MVITARPDGGIEVHAPVTVTADETTSVVLNTPPVQSTTVTPSTTADTDVTLAGVTVTIPSSTSLTLPDGSGYSGDIEVRVAPLDSDTVTPVPLPQGMNSDGTSFDSNPFLMFDVSMFASGGANDGNPLQLANNQTVGIRREVSFDDDTLQAVAGLNNQIPLLRYDPDTAKWVDVGTLTYADGVVTGALPHLSIYGGFGTAFYSFSYSYPTVCQKGRIMDGSQGRKASIQVETFVYTRGGAIIKRSGTTTDADGNFCIEVPPAGAMSSIEQWNASDPTHVKYSLPVRLRALKVDNRYVALPAAPAVTNDMMCGAGATCDDIGMIQHPLGMNPKPPTCAANASICDDGNSCTTDSCDSATMCPAGTSCSGCSNTASTGSCDDGNSCTTNDTCSAQTCSGTKAPSVGVASGFTAPPTLTLMSAGMTGVTFEDSFAAAPSDIMWNMPIEVNSGTATSSGGRLVITDTDPADTNGPTSLNLSGPSDRVGALSGAGHIDVAFVLPSAANDAASTIELTLSDDMGSVRATLMRSGATGSAFQLSVDGGSGPQSVTLPAGLVHVLRIARDASGNVSATVTPNGGSPVTIAGGALSAAAPWTMALSMTTNTISGQTGNVDVFELDAITSNVTFDLPAQWALSNSPLSYGGTDYADVGGGAFGVLWYGAHTTGGIDLVWDGTTMTPIAFDGVTSTIKAYLISATMGMTPLHVTIYSESDANAISAALTGLGITPFTIDATIDVLTRNSDGTYSSSLISCP